MRRLSIIAVLLLASAALGQSKELRVPAGLIEIPLGAQGNPDIDITWEARDPMDLQYRVYEDGHVFVTYAVAGSRLIIQSDVIDWEKRQRAKVNWIVTVGDGPTPPGPTPDPTPDPSTAPFPSPGFAVMVIRESSEMGQLPPEQRSIFTSSSIANYLRGHCVQLEDGEIAARFFDDDFTENQLRKTPETMRAAYRVAKQDSNGQLPWIVISNGKTGFSGPLPGSINATMELMQKYGG